MQPKLNRPSRLPTDASENGEEMLPSEFSQSAQQRSPANPLHYPVSAFHIGDSVDWKWRTGRGESFAASRFVGGCFRMRNLIRKPVLPRVFPPYFAVWKAFNNEPSQHQI